jgi:hypothetical protein
MVCFSTIGTLVSAGMTTALGFSAAAGGTLVALAKGAELDWANAREGSDSDNAKRVNGRRMDLLLTGCENWPGFRPHDKLAL